jgi:hypothetical protein
VSLAIPESNWQEDDSGPRSCSSSVVWTVGWYYSYALYCPVEYWDRDAFSLLPSLSASGQAIAIPRGFSG